MHLGQWDKLAQYNEKVTTDDKHFWNAAINIAKNNLDEAKLNIKKARESLDNLVSSLL